MKSALSGLEKVFKHRPKGLVKYNDVMVVKGEGCYVFTADGKKLLDMTSGIGVTSTGHCHPAVVKAVQEQAGTIVHAQQNIFGAHTQLLELTDRLSNIMPPSLDQYFLCNSGAEAVDNAVKIARYATGRPNIICFEGGFHGRTIGAMALTTSKTIYREGFSPLMPGVAVAPYPYCKHCKVPHGDGSGSAPPVCCGTPLESLKWLLEMQSSPADTAAILIEPILGEGGFLVPPPGFLEGIRKICSQHGILMIADEVQSGAGRTGLWWGHQHFLGNKAVGSSGAVAASTSSDSSAPDLLVFAKGIASGYPLAGVAARAEHFTNMTPGALGGTYGGNAVACAAAVATIDTIQNENLMANAVERGKQLQDGLIRLQKDFPEIIDIRGRGLMVGVELARHKTDASGQQAAVHGIASAVTKACSRRDMLLLTAGARETIRFLPPLVVTAEQIHAALSTLEAALHEVFRKGPSN